MLRTPPTHTLRGSFSAVSKPIFEKNARWKSLDEIYKINILLHRSGLKISAKNRRFCFPNCAGNFANFCILSIELIVFRANFDENSLEFHGIRRSFVGNVKTSCNWLKFCQFPVNCPPRKKRTAFLEGGSITFTTQNLNLSRNFDPDPTDALGKAGRVRGSLPGLPS
jgi:hypothetical protein